MDPGDLPVDPGEFLRRHPPFDQLPGDLFAEIERALELVFAPAGQRLLVSGGEPSAYLWVVRKGTVHLDRDGRTVEVVEEGEPFGYPSLISGKSPLRTALAARDSLLLRLPRRAFERLLTDAGAAHFFLAGLAERLAGVGRLETEQAVSELALPLDRLKGRHLVTVPPDATVAEAARRMTRERVGSVVVEGDPPGIVTDRDLRSRVLAEGRGPETPVAEVMSSPLSTLPATASLFEALTFMLERRVHHVPITERDEVVGVVTATDLMRAQARSPLHLGKSIERAASREEIASYRAELTSAVSRLARGGLKATELGRVVASLHATLTRNLLGHAEATLGPPPCGYAWIVFGSEGRREQILPTDQDNALVYAAASPEADAYFPRLAESVVDGLLTAGFPPCPGGFMATRWCHPLAQWRGRFGAWIDEPTPEALLDASSFFDFRAVAGDLDLAPLEAVVGAAAEQPTFLRTLAGTCLQWHSPVGLFGRLQEGDDGLDLKRGVMAIVSLARLFALAAGVPARSTLERLAAVAGGQLAERDADTLTEAFRFLLALRLDHQLEALDRGEELSNKVRLARLNAMERRFLKDVFRFLSEAQEEVALRFDTRHLG